MLRRAVIFSLFPFASLVAIHVLRVLVRVVLF